MQRDWNGTAEAGYLAEAEIHLFLWQKQWEGY